MVRDALVVGINNYQDDNLGNLNAPAEDAEAVSCLLEQYGEFNVWRLPEVVDPDTKKVFIAKTQELSLTRFKKVFLAESSGETIKLIICTKAISCRVKYHAARNSA